MSWVIAILLALAGFAAIAVLSGQKRAAWAVVLAALGFGLAGYATQASPGIKSAPKQGVRAATGEGEQFVALRVELVGEARRSHSPYTLMSDGYARGGQFEEAAALLRGAVSKDQRDGDAWLALGNALLLHADGQLTPAAIYAYRRAEQELPGSAATAFFIGVGMIREGRLIEAHRLWSERLAALPEGAPGREILAERLGALEQLLRQIVRESGEAGQ